MQWIPVILKGETGNKEGVDIYIMNPWRNFTEGYWQSEIDVREFIQLNHSPPMRGMNHFWLVPPEGPKSCGIRPPCY